MRSELTSGAVRAPPRPASGLQDPVWSVVQVGGGSINGGGKKEALLCRDPGWWGSSNPALVWGSRGGASEDGR